MKGGEKLIILNAITGLASDVSDVSAGSTTAAFAPFLAMIAGFLILIVIW